MTIQTVCTVGFNEVQPFGEAGKYFTMVLILTSFGTFAYAVSVITQYIVDGSINHYYLQKKVQKGIDQLSNHIIICGFGRNGRQAARKLEAYGATYVVIDRDDARWKSYQNNYHNLHFLKGDAQNDETLINAGIERCSALISALPNDADNLFVVLSARQLKPEINIISRANEESTEKKLRAAGATHTVMPYKVGGQHMAELLMSPRVAEFLDHLSVGGKSDTNIEEVAVHDLPQSWGINRISDLQIRKTTGCSVIGLRRSTGEYIINPDPDQLLEPNTSLFVLGTTEQLNELRALFK